MCEIQGFVYKRNESDPSPTVMDLHRIANMNNLVLADIEAEQLLEIVRRKVKIPYSLEPIYTDLIINLMYEQGFGRMLSCEEEEELIAHPNLVLIEG